MEEEGSLSSHKIAGVTDETEELTIYSGIRQPIMSQIKNIDVDGSFGTKIDTLARHILWVREHDPGAKSIVFSQYKEFLEVLARAFCQFHIGFTSIGQKDGVRKFRNDPEVCTLKIRRLSSRLIFDSRSSASFCTPRLIHLD